MSDIEQLHAYFAARPDVLLAYLFGSRTEGRATSDSDYDIAVLTQPKLAPARQFEVASELCRLLNGKPVDLVALNNAPVELSYAVVATGRRVFEREAAVRVEFEATVLSRYGDLLPMLREQRRELVRGERLNPEFAGIERRLDKLNECLQKLEPLRQREPDEFLADSYLRDIVERNLEVAAQRCIDISNRIISLENAPRPRDHYESLLRLGEIDVLPMEFARHLAPLGGFRNILVLSIWMSIGNMCWIICMKSATPRSLLITCAPGCNGTIRPHPERAPGQVRRTIDPRTHAVHP